MSTAPGYKKGPSSFDAPAQPTPFDFRTGSSLHTTPPQQSPSTSPSPFERRSVIGGSEGTPQALREAASLAETELARVMREIVEIDRACAAAHEHERQAESAVRAAQRTLIEARQARQSADERREAYRRELTVAFAAAEGTRAAYLRTQAGGMPSVDIQPKPGGPVMAAIEAGSTTKVSAEVEDAILAEAEKRNKAQADAIAKARAELNTKKETDHD